MNNNCLRFSLIVINLSKDCDFIILKVLSLHVKPYLYHLILNVNKGERRLCVILFLFLCFLLSLLSSYLLSSTPTLYSCVKTSYLSPIYSPLHEPVDLRPSHLSFSLRLTNLKGLMRFRSLHSRGVPLSHWSCVQGLGIQYHIQILYEYSELRTHQWRSKLA